MDPARVAVIVQARMSSRRLPGKVLSPLAGAPAIVRMIARVRRMKTSTRVIVATSRDRSDDPLVAVCAVRGIETVRGSLDDVLGRVAAAVPPDYNVVVRLTADCPLVDPALVDRHVERFAAADAEDVYVSNTVRRTYPDGLDVEVVSRQMLAEAARVATDAYDREHVTPWIQRHARQMAITQAIDLSDVRWVLDTPGDYSAIAGVYERLYPANDRFSSEDVYRLLIDQPDLIRLAEAGSIEEARGRMRKLLDLAVAL